MLHVASCVSEQRRSQVETKVKTKDAETQTENGKDKDKDKEKKRNEMRRFYKKQIDSISVSSSQRAAHYKQNTLGGEEYSKEWAWPLDLPHCADVWVANACSTTPPVDQSAAIAPEPPARAQDSPVRRLSWSQLSSISPPC